jgi:hypothetical protein
MVVVGARNRQQRIVGRTIEAARVEDRFIVEVEQQRHPGRFVRQQIVGAFAQRVEDQHRSLYPVDLVGQHLLPRCRPERGSAAAGGGVDHGRHCRP